MAIYGPGYRKSHKYPSQDWLNNDDIYTASLWKQQSLAEDKMRRFFAHFASMAGHRRVKMIVANHRTWKKILGVFCSILLSR